MSVSPRERATGLHLWTAAAPSGQRVTILLEELGMSSAVELHTVDLQKREQHGAEFAETINPAQLVPALVDHDAGGQPIIESGAVLMYLLECKAPAAGGEAAAAAQALLPSPTDAARRGQVLAWLFWQMSTCYAAARRFFAVVNRGAPGTPETMRYAAEQLQVQLAVLEGQLAKTGSYVAGNFYSVADIACFPFVALIASVVGADLAADMPALDNWMRLMKERPAVRKGMNVPGPAPLLRPGQEADVTVHKLRCALLDVGVKGVAVGAPRTVVLPE